MHIDVEKRNKALKKMVLFTLIMAIICLIYMLVTSYLSEKSKFVIDLSTLELVQLEEPEDGDPIAVIDTSLGEIRTVLYPEYAPNTVANFTELAESGYYDNTYVFHSEKGVYSAAGCPNKNGDLPDDFDKSRELVERELHQNLWPFKGALCSMTTTFKQSFGQRFTGGGTHYCGSRFALLNTVDITDEMKQQIFDLSNSKKLTDAFAEKGGVPNFSQQIVVFGQVYEGLDIVEQLSELKVEENEGSTKIPVDDVMINSIKIDKYSSEKTEKEAVE